MARSARVQVINETAYDESKIGKAWVLCLQWCRYIYDDGAMQMGFRFIWRRPDGSLQAARGQARIPDLDKVEALMKKAKDLGWGHNSSKENKEDNT